MLAESLATFAPVVLTVAVTVAITISGDGLVVDPNWTWGNVTDKTTFSWHLSGSLNNKAITADGYGYGHGYRQHHRGKGGKGFGEHGLPNLAWALAWEGHAGLHFFT